MAKRLASPLVYNDEGINFDDIPEIKDFSGWRRHPLAGTFNGEYTVIVEHEGYNEVIKLNYNNTPPTREVLEIIPTQDVSKPLGDAVNF